MLMDLNLALQVKKKPGGDAGSMHDVDNTI